VATRRAGCRWSLAVRIAVGVLGVAVGLLAAEAWVRIAKPRPRRQVVRGFGLHSVDGVPVWSVADDRENRACVDRHPERTRILFFGSSITFGDRLSADDVVTALLEKRLNDLQPSPGFCVLNFAQNGFDFEQKYVVARAEAARYRPALIMWENWIEWQDYRLIGDAAYGITDFAVRPDGFIGIAGVPDSLNRALFLHSRLYEYLTLTFGESASRLPGPQEVTAFTNNRLIKVVDLARSVGAKLVFYLAPPLDQPFAETAATLPEWHRIILDFARAHGVPAYPLQRELIGEDYLQLRMDPCCHYNSAGHTALVPGMTRIVLEQLRNEARPAVR
jgi:hypothetical protein